MAKTERALSKGLAVKRYFTKPDVHPYDEIEWDVRDAIIPNYKEGGNAFEQRGVEFPATWSVNATNIVAQKYFRGPLGTPQRESSVRQLIDRVADTITGWGWKDGYFASEGDRDTFNAELKHILVNQKAAFNSPVWFNVGSEKDPQGSACFILAVEDTMSSILNWYVEEGTIFKGGSGSGVNLSNIRSSKERLSAGGEASGPVSFMRGADASAGTIKSGGKTRRAAKMTILNIDHPDVDEFIWCKAREEEKARVLRDAGFDMDLDGRDAYSIQYQNANNSVRVTDEFMQAYLNDEEWGLRAVTTGEVIERVRARHLMRDIAKAAWECADPGMQYDTIINDWHTCPASGRINASNPCCFVGQTLVITEHGPVRIELLQKMAEAGESLPRVLTLNPQTGAPDLAAATKVWVAGETRELARVRTTEGHIFECTPDHRFLTSRGYVQAKDLESGEILVGLDIQDRSRDDEVAEVQLISVEESVSVYDMEVAGTHNFVVTSDNNVVGGVVVHNSEYMHLDNSACNLASLNLLKFVDEDLNFDIQAFRHAIDIIFLAQEILVGNSSYPTEKIGKNARDYRELGIGYANLGALLMSRGLPYDSEAGRAWAGAITALMTGWAYRASAQFAEKVGPYAGYAPNREAHLRVMRKHRAAVDDIDPELVPEGLLQASKTAWDEAIVFGEKHGYRNSQASVLAPTGCLVGGTLVPTERGLVRLRSLGDPDGQKWQDLGIDVATDEGPRMASKFYLNGIEPVVDVVTGRGYSIRGTTLHRIKVVEDGEWAWKRLADVKAGDVVPLALGGLVGSAQDVALPPISEAHWTGEHHVRVPTSVTPELAELVGYFMGDGSLHSRGLRLCVDRNDFDVVERLAMLAKDQFGIEAQTAEKKGYTEVALHSVRLVEWWRACGFARYEPREGHSGKGWLPHIPDAILHTNDPQVYASFVRGLFEADGTVNVGYPSWSTTSLGFSREVQSLLLALGFPTTRKFDTTGWGQSQLSVLRLLNSSYNSPWLESVGFISSRKNAAVLSSENRQAARKDAIPVSRALIDRLAPANDRLRKVLLMEHNRSGMVSRRVAKELIERTGDAELERLMGFFYDRVESAALGEEEMTYDLSVPDNVTYVANGFVSHNTIGLMMDCDTTGIEPDLALVKTKKLVGGGTMRIVNQTVPRALQRLGYSPDQVEEITAHIHEHNSVDGAPHIRPEHEAVFDCAMGDRTIHYMGHVNMMAAAQPFISGAISKTVNLPETVTVEEVENLFAEGWRLGLKALAIYRDNCKVAQPLSADKKQKTPAPIETAVEAPTPLPDRKRLPKSRPSRTISFRVGDAEGYMTAGMYPDDGLGEVFLKVSKQGSTLSGVMDALAIAVSIGLQYGVPLEAYVKKFMNMRFEPSGMTDDPDIRFANSLVDYIFRRLAMEFLDENMRNDLGIRTIEERKVEVQAKTDAPPAPVVIPAPTVQSSEESRTAVKFADAPYCYNCGNKMQPAGSCFVCESCGSTSGCS